MGFGVQGSGFRVYGFFAIMAVVAPQPLSLNTLNPKTVGYGHSGNQIRDGRLVCGLCGFRVGKHSQQ